MHKEHSSNNLKILTINIRSYRNNKNALEYMLL